MRDLVQLTAVIRLKNECGEDVDDGDGGRRKTTKTTCMELN